MFTTTISAIRLTVNIATSQVNTILLRVDTRTSVLTFHYLVLTNVKLLACLVRDIDAHRKVCPLEEVDCTNNCRIILQQQYLALHVEMECPRRKVDCQYCHISLEYQLMKDDHRVQCLKFPIPCPNECEIATLPRDSVDEDKKVCLVQCDYHVVGCEENIPRKHVNKHNKENFEQHLSFTTHNLAISQVEVTSSRDQLTGKIF